MITGFNTDVEYEGRIYHVQTEDKGQGNPVLESLIYLGGEVLASHRRSYQDLIASGPNPKAVAERLELQHQRMVLNVRQGRHDPAGLKAFGEGIISERGFEQVVLEYLGKELAKESLQVMRESPSRFEPGRRQEVALRARGELSSMPVAGVKIVLSFLTPVEKPRVLAEGTTDAEGLFRQTVAIPPVDSGGALILLARIEKDMVELKWLVPEPEGVRG